MLLRIARPVGKEIGPGLILLSVFGLQLGKPGRLVRFSQPLASVGS
jgi:hypothetical protein